MSYYILPKNINIIHVNPESSEKKCNPYISFSLLNYYNFLNSQIANLFGVNDISYNETFKIVNPYEFIYSKVPGSKYSVSKLKPNTNLFYDLIEIITNLNVFFSFKDKNINILNVTSNYSDSIECISLFRENHHDLNVFFSEYNLDNNIENKFDFIFYETNFNAGNVNDYFKSILNVLLLIFKNQSYEGNIIIKIGDIIYKPVVDVLYIITSLYDKVYICKPKTNNLTSSEKYIICKSFLYNNTDDNYLKLNYYKILIFIKKLEEKFIKQILNYDIPYYFKSKLCDSNVIIGQQQLESLEQIISICQTKNKEDKIEIIKKSNIQKSVLWCEKYQIPCNKFTEKTNIFLPINDN